MKKQFTVILLVILSCILFAQEKVASYMFNYQAIVRGSSGEVLPNHTVSFRVNILQGSLTGSSVFEEEHTSISTNDFGLVAFEIGGGENQTGNISSIPLGSDDYYIQIELDETGGTTYQLMGVSPLLYVPKAVYAETAGEAETVLTENQQLSISGNDLSISGTGGNTVTLPSSIGMPAGVEGNMLYHNGTEWNNSSILFHDNNKIGFGTNTPSSRIDVEWDSEYTPGLNVNNSSAADGSVTIRGEAMWYTSGYLGVQGEDNFASISDLDLDNHRIGAMGISESTNGYGLYGYGNKYGGYFKNDNLNTVGLAGNDAAIEVNGGAVFGTETSAVKILDIIEISGNTDLTSTLTWVTLPTGWTADKVRVMTYEVMLYGDRWVSGNFPGFNSEDSYGYLYMPDNSVIHLSLPDDPLYKDIPYRIVLMRTE